nr:unnamed protein product [Ipomoea batatas]
MAEWIRTAIIRCREWCIAKCKWCLGGSGESKLRFPSTPTSIPSGMLSLTTNALRISFPIWLAAREFLVLILDGFGWSREVCNGHYIGTLKLMLYWISKNLSTQKIFVNSTFPWLMVTSRSLKVNGLSNLEKGKMYK